MNKQTFFFISALVFTFGGVLHLSRAVMGWSMTFNGMDLPLWASWSFSIFILLFAIQAWILGIKTKRK